MKNAEAPSRTIGYAINAGRVVSATPFEPGLIGVLRIFAVFHIFKSALMIGVAVAVAGGPDWIDLAPLVTSLAFLAYVFSGVLRARLGGWYLLVTVLLSTLDSLITKGTFWFWQATHQLAFDPRMIGNPIGALAQWALNDGILIDALAQPLLQISMLIALLLLLIVISWQYDFRFAFAFAVLTAVLDVVLNILPVPLSAAQMQFGGVIIIGRTLIFLIVGRLIAHLVGIQRKQRHSLMRANDELARYAEMVEELTISRERNRMARELHDTLAHTLSAASVQLEATHSLWTRDPNRAHDALKRSLSTVRNGLTETRRALKALRASPLEDLGLSLALKELGEVTQQRSGAQVLVSVPNELELIPAETEQVIYRVAQEALENIVRHARAKRVRVALTQRLQHVDMLIEDDGVGFDVESMKRDPDRFGMRGIVERIEGLGGQVRIDSAANGGTRIALEVATA